MRPGTGHCTVRVTYQTNSISQDFSVSGDPIGIKQISSIVKEFSLGQNFPNPFNPNTKINFTLPKAEYAYLRVYDILGREVSVLYNGYKKPGNYQIEFDGSNLASGVYFFTLISGDYRDTKKMLLIK